MRKFLLGLLLALFAANADAQLLLPNGQQQFVDANGVPLAGGQVYFYIPATTQTKTTWQDFGLTTPNTNPVILNSAGRATIWGSGEYREIVYDVNGNLIWDQNTFAPTPTGSQGGFGAQSPLSSAATVDLGSGAPGHNALISGITTISSFGSSASVGAPVYLVQFSGALTLTNSSQLQLPGGNNITTQNGSWLFAYYLGTGNWQVLEYGTSSVNGGGFGALVTEASAATTDLGLSGTNNVKITGIATITSFGSTASLSFPLYQVTFGGSLQLTNSSSLALPDGQNITTQSGDMAWALYLGSGNWEIVNYNRANGQTLSWSGPEQTLASASTVDLGTATSNLVKITGVTTITSFGSSASLANPTYIIRAAGTFSLTNSASLICPGGANLGVNSGDSLVVEYQGSGVWQVLSYNSNSGATSGVLQAGSVTGSPAIITFNSAVLNAPHYIVVYLNETNTPSATMTMDSADALAHSWVQIQTVASSTVTTGGSGPISLITIPSANARGTCRLLMNAAGATRSDGHFDCDSEGSGAGEIYSAGSFYMGVANINHLSIGPNGGTVTYVVQGF